MKPHLVPVDGPLHPLPFPLGKTGGLIEAILCQQAFPIYDHSFRWVKPAASLKRHLL